MPMPVGNGIHSEEYWPATCPILCRLVTGSDSGYRS